MVAIQDQLFAFPEIFGDFVDVFDVFVLKVYVLSVLELW
jgi:hypothetical protein